MKRVVAASVGLWNVKKERNKHLGVYGNVRRRNKEEEQ